MQSQTTMTVRKDGWVKGSTDGFSFEALVFSEASEWGINKGPVSKLFITKEKQVVLAYDRRWEKESQQPAVVKAFQKIMNSLESLLTLKA